ncbi:hypothetical protein ACWGR3_01105 [Streptomyces albidoflavus]|uniref:hypothetical protein n=1 Tax=Streptomyces TaxID=1883 RepID=UPI000A962821|nr:MULTISPECIES: hypothetical protein [unclassified Streptomyces]MCG5118495.1 hypothetical protein [Streptomyces sp. T7(2022)]
MATPSAPFGTGQPALLHLADDQFGATPLWLIIAVGVLIVDVLIVRWSASPR